MRIFFVADEADDGDGGAFDVGGDGADAAADEVVTEVENDGEAEADACCGESFGDFAGEGVDACVVAGGAHDEEGAQDCEDGSCEADERCDFCESADGSGAAFEHGDFEHCGFFSGDSHA